MLSFLSFFNLMPSWLKFLAGAGILIGVLQLQHWWEIRKLNGHISTLQTEVARQKADNATLRAGITEQNSRVREFASTARVKEAEAATKALQVTLETESQSEILRDPEKSPIEPGHEAMNEWLREQFHGPH